eukprot:TRINITY_DN4208_c0_g2_i12.p2 TRINITY_DN4208_c0_g2~~TRINITY_DN4208_c0_g2_i12.p2  ORF type:complete len:293 (-),score=87.48 TRINITY_DN4208_c0_g2_i12:101-979(-)
MLIEKDARRYVVQAIKCDRELKSLETNERLKGRVVLRTPQYDILRKELVETCSQINAVANVQGKGRDDLTIEILLAAEDTLHKVTGHKSKAIRKLAEQIKLTFCSLRHLFRRYSENIEAVDPQLRNNLELSEALLAFERAWERGKEFLLSADTKATLLSMSGLIEGLMEKHKETVEKIEAMDADIFITVPCLAILKAIDGNGKGTSLCREGKELEEARRNYRRMKGKSEGYELYNALERMVLEKKVEERAGSKVKLEDMNKLVHSIKQLAIVIQRSNPTEWNSLMETAMGII